MDASQQDVTDMCNAITLADPGGLGYMKVMTLDQPE